ncbi:hypothetical protein GW944_01290 [Candidatus Parcubacteria bacterium]|nr:hypothetical protein [Candidatus Parcubacteria bacterium]
MGVEFEENNFARGNFAEQTPKLASWLIKKGLAKDVAGANMVQVIAAIIFFALAIFFAVK